MPLRRHFKGNDTDRTKRTFSLCSYGVECCCRSIAGEDAHVPVWMPIDCKQRYNIGSTSI